MASSVTAFAAGKKIAAGEPGEVAGTIAKLLTEHDGTILVFEDETERVSDLDYRATKASSAGRPKLGVQAREVTLLPRHWEWLSSRPGGASAELRRLVEAARKAGKSDRERQDAAYRFMQAACGDLPGYEEALRALYAQRQRDFRAIVDHWPPDYARYIASLLGTEPAQTGDDS